eukprot:Rmarinus@m.4096
MIMFRRSRYLDFAETVVSLTKFSVCRIRLCRLQRLPLLGYVELGDWRTPPPRPLWARTTTTTATTTTTTTSTITPALPRTIASLAQPRPPGLSLAPSLIPVAPGARACSTSGLVVPARYQTMAARGQSALGPARGALVLPLRIALRSLVLPRTKTSEAGSVLCGLMMTIGRKTTWLVSLSSPGEMMVYCVCLRTPPARASTATVPACQAYQKLCPSGIRRGGFDSIRGGQRRLDSHLAFLAVHEPGGLRRLSANLY